MNRILYHITVDLQHPSGELRGPQRTSVSRWERLWLLHAAERQREESNTAPHPDRGRGQGGGKPDGGAGAGSWQWLSCIDNDTSTSVSHIDNKVGYTFAPVECTPMPPVIYECLHRGKYTWIFKEGFLLVFSAPWPAGLRRNQAEATAHLHPGGQPGWVCAHGRQEDHRRHAVAAEAGVGLRQHRHQPAAGGAVRFPRCCEYQTPPRTWTDRWSDGHLDRWIDWFPTEIRPAQFKPVLWRMVLLTCTTV